jgi:hypothetical protein
MLKGDLWLFKDYDLGTWIVKEAKKSFYENVILTWDLSVVKAYLEEC